MQPSAQGGGGAAPAARVDAIEGLRGYLALWVVVCHVFYVTGITGDSLSGLPKLLRQGDLAVDLFIIVSGFVIFMCLDTQVASYRQFVIQRFWRLFPLFIVLFAVAIPLSSLEMSNMELAPQFHPPAEFATTTVMHQGWWDHFEWNVVLHVLMLNGLVPDRVMPGAPGAFLVPAWSVSLEWQFYLVAPLAYAMAMGARRWQRIALLTFCAASFLAARYALPPVDFGAALPFHVEYFALGAASYVLYRRRSMIVQRDVWLAGALVLSMLVLSMYKLSWGLIPIALWIAFLGVLLEPSGSWSSRLATPWFTNPVSRHLGKISYSVYLSHYLLIFVLQRALLVGLPQLDRAAHFWVLLAATFAATIALSTLLYRFIEAPGIRAGRILSRDLGIPSRQDSSERAAPPRRSPV